MTAEITFEDLVAGLRRWASGQSTQEQAAVELLVWKDIWLRRPDFCGACITQHAADQAAVISWGAARGFIDRGYCGEGEPVLPSSSTERRMLDLAVAIGEDRFGLAHLGAAHQYAAAQAFAAACQQALRPPSVRHNHPPFVPGDGTCPACVLEADAIPVPDR